MRHSWLLAALTSALATAMLTTAFLGRWPDTATLLLGDGGVLPFLVAIVTLVFLGVNSRQASSNIDNTRRTLEQAQAAGLATRFQKGLELLDSEHPATKIGGIAVLRDVATQSPQLYWPPVVEVLITLVESGTRDIYDTHVHAME